MRRNDDYVLCVVHGAQRRGNSDSRPGFSKQKAMAKRSKFCHIGFQGKHKKNKILRHKMQKQMKNETVKTQNIARATMPVAAREQKRRCVRVPVC